MKTIEITPETALITAEKYAILYSIHKIKKETTKAHRSLGQFQVWSELYLKCDGKRSEIARISKENDIIKTT